MKRFSFDARSYVVKREGYAATDPIALDGVAPNNTTEQSQDREETVPADNNTQNANMAPPKTKTEAEKKAQRAKKARERRERKKANAKFATDAAAADAQELTPAPSGRATETPQPLDDLMNASLGQNGKKRAYDVTHAGAKVVTGAKKVSRKRAAPDSPPAQAEDSADYENDDDQEDDDTDLSDFDHLTELIGQVTTLKLERIEQDNVNEKAEKKYNLAKRLYQAGTLNKKAFDVKAKKCETSLEIGIAAHEARKVKLIALEVCGFSLEATETHYRGIDTDSLNRMMLIRSSVVSPHACSSPTTPPEISLRTSRTCRCIIAAVFFERGMNTNNAKPKDNRKRRGNPESKRLPISGLSDSDATARTSTSSPDLSCAKSRATLTIKTRRSRQLYLFSPAFS